jgi:predicted transcriptional regulator
MEDSNKAAVLALHSAGKSTVEICESLGLSPSEVTRFLNGNGKAV